ncbi:MULTISPECIES: AMP-binding protein [Odoribacter]|uniref:AMP-binding protein n=1 Tax=Odoribacter splanchnicus TaxID=28118 RepID=A0A412TRU5_9BACT|nr:MULTISPECIES: AMP-binding protein [Odoribacter]MDB9210405.1 AMP-binding protein [Odoribacter splanchnicus]MDB9225817.1 AMP-binding protein [Odoribacter splanchnicus]MDB9236390.1 AMP-binding protein [Odoribacter splanchnicus]MDB9240550.1 AMP-binding protein [Odoribacter splanchnicus]MDB9246674.1 AMP-binding protein [Odoribacter splanchnicus]
MQATLSYACGISDIPLKGETIGQNLRQIAAKFPERTALISEYQQYRANYSEFLAQVEQVAKALMAHGIRRGDRVGIWSPNRYEWVLVQYATALMGAIMVNINPGYKLSGLRYALEQSRIDLLIASSHFRKTDYIKMLDELRPDCLYPKQTVIIDRDWATFLSSASQVSDARLAEREASLQFDDPVNIQYTSGTTGYPKGATLSHHNILNNGFFIGERLKYTEKDIVCLPVPFYHCFGMVLGNMAIVTHGACIVIPGEFFDPEQVLQTVENERCTSLYGVPTMFIAELDLPDFAKYNLKSLRTGIMAGAPCPIDTMRKVQSLMNMTEICVCYGMTETSPVSTESCTDDPLELRVTTVGTVHPHVEIKIIDPESGAIVPRGTAGELCTRGYSVMLGYWDNPEDTKAIIDETRWLHSGDIAVMDENGYVSIVGRIKDLIIRGGENISPKEIEDFLIVHEGVSDVQVIGVYSEKYGEEVMAWIKPRPGYNVSAESLHTYCKGRIATFKIPRYWKFVDAFPMTVTGKIRKIEMREISEKELGLDLLRPKR